MVQNFRIYRKIDFHYEILVKKVPITRILVMKKSLFRGFQLWESHYFEVILGYRISVHKKFISSKKVTI